MASSFAFQSNPRRKKSSRTASGKEAILKMMIDETIPVSYRIGIPQTTTWRVLKGEKLQPYHFQRVQVLTADDILVP